MRCILKSGESFLGDFHQETADGFVLGAGSQRFFVPHQEIASVERDVSGPRIEATIGLVDGALVRGPLAREDGRSVVIASGDGFIVVPRRKIRRIETRPLDAGAPPPRFQIENPGWNLARGPAVGLRGFGGAHGGALSANSAGSAGGGVFYDSSAQWFGFLQPGMEISYSAGKANVNTFLGQTEGGGFRQGAFVIYSHHNYNWGDFVQLYGRLGGGVSVSSISTASASARSNHPVIQAALGWRAAVGQSFDLRIGLRSEVFFPGDGAWSRSGLELSLQYVW